MTEDAIIAFLLVFVRCSAMLATCPVFASPNASLKIRIFITLAIAGALTMVIQPHLGEPPQSMYELIAAVVREALAGVLIGSMVSLAMHGIQMAGSLMDLSSGLASGQVMNPLNGVQTTLLSQFKSMMGMVVFLSVNAHHVMIRAFVDSYHVLPTFTQVQGSFLAALGQISILSLQIAAPVMACGFLVDAALALLSRAVPQMPAMMVGMPAKIGVGLVAVAIGLPMTVAGVSAMLQVSFTALRGLFKF